MQEKRNALYMHTKNLELKKGSIYMRIIYAGSSPFSVPALQLLIEKKLVVAVLSAPNRRSGRGMKITKNIVVELAEAHNIPVLQPESLRGEVLGTVASYHPDILVCASYGKIFGPKFLSLFARGSINIHPSLLPRFRGAAPIPGNLACRRHTYRGNTTAYFTRNGLWQYCVDITLCY